jgi:hypothetical protein
VEPEQHDLVLRIDFTVMIFGIGGSLTRSAQVTLTVQ